MQYAITHPKTRSKPSYSGQKAVCAYCSGELIGKCGEILVWHWQHKQNAACDPWKEHETDWHRNWKARFPEHCQEVIIETPLEKHIADVQSSNGIVIEFQNSPISQGVIRAREAFYNNMVWVINAAGFKDNFNIRSLVKSKLWELEHNSHNQYDGLITILDEAIAETKKDLKSTRDQIENAERNIEWRKDDINRLNELKDSISILIKRLVESWLKGENFWQPGDWGITHGLQDIYKPKFTQAFSNIKALEEKNDTLQNRMNEIELLEDFFVNGKGYKLVAANLINKAFYSQVIAITKATRKTLFPVLQHFSSEHELQNALYWRDRYDFAFDPSPSLSRAKETIQANEEQMALLKASLAAMQLESAQDMSAAADNKLEAFKTDLAKMEIELPALREHGELLERRLQRRLEERDNTEEEAEAEMAKEKKMKRSAIMQEKKGLYTFDWKHERRSWQAATKPIYFDIGENCLFEKQSDGLFKKVFIVDFLARFK